MASLNLGRVVGSRWYAGVATDNSSIASQVTNAGYTALEGDMYLNTSTGDIYTYSLNGSDLLWQITGNIKGATGDAFTISKIYSSVTEMNDGYANDGVSVGGFVIINTNDVEEEDNAKLYVKGESSYEYITDLSGATGIQGPMPVVSTTATVTTISGETASVYLTGSGTDTSPYTFVFTIPKGDTGATGAAAGFGDITASVDSNVGTPSVTVTASGEDTAKNIDFAFKNLKGEKGDTGSAAGFGTLSATVDSNVGTPSVEVATSGDDTAKNITFTFKNLKGETGATGSQGIQGIQGEKGETGAAAGFGTITATIDNSVGTPSVSVVTSGENTAKNITFSFTGIKGETGASGATGPTGATGADGKTPTFEINSSGELVATWED